MNAIIVLTRSLLRQTVRNRQGLFWTLFFPLVLMLVFSFLGNSQNRVNLAIVAPPGQSPAVVKAFQQSPLFHVQKLGRHAALQEVQRGQMDAALLIPSEVAHHTTTLTLRYNNANAVSAQQAVGAVDAFVAQTDIALSGSPPLFRVSAHAMTHSHSATYLDFLLPGILALMTMQNSLFGIGSGLTRWKEKGILRRFRATPVKPAQLLAATVVNYVVIGLASAAIVIGFATLILHASVLVPVGPTLLVLLLGMASFLSIGFIVAGLSKSQEATIPIINLISFPMMFLSGVFFPVSSLPRILADIVQYFPLTYVSNALRGLMSGQLTIGAAAFRTDMVGLAVWIVVTGAIASRAWRWE
ncbi:ABC transporter permease [Sulfobacillus harzensis]|uniref:Transport permease protein n=1 Tax=Sulfobacillus harzensis TaxID=2729629 RepID=A0A7Y0L495_9FIRM|nr:ABC transporter permease [Sulfobacillus harzensis]NMP22798.1 ABC transporter permease [Sulfobacillus harzensis]